VKFKDADLIGFPLRVGVGAKSLANGQVEWSWRKDRAKQLAAPADVITTIIAAVKKARALS
jgi:prolyl-tRNA synthetase